MHKNFNTIGIKPALLDVLRSMEFTTPTPIQNKAIPVAMEGNDLIGLAQTGTGKTLAFGIPMVQRLSDSQNSKGLILVPTRELAIQVNSTICKLATAFNMKTTVLIGGESYNKQLAEIKQNPHIIIATPGRLNDHIQQKSIRLDNVSILVLDEADRMLDMGFLPQIRSILRTIPKQRQTLLFSATMPPEISAIAYEYMSNPIKIEVTPSGTPPELISQELFIVKRESKMRLLEELLSEYRGTVLVFVRTRWTAVAIAKKLRRFKHEVAEIHSDCSMPQRKKSLEGFKTGKFRILVATDIASRGIDVSGIELVVNYDIPDDPENYVHRIGRTGRAGLQGHAISIATPDQLGEIKKIERIIKTPIKVSEHPKFPRTDFIPVVKSTTRSFLPSGWRRSKLNH